jgi:hypothetical protein
MDRPEWIRYALKLNFKPNSWKQVRFYRHLIQWYLFASGFLQAVVDHALLAQEKLALPGLSWMALPEL